MENSFKIFVPYLGPSTNAMYSGQHWAKRKSHKFEAKRAVGYALAFRECKSFENPVDILIEPVAGPGKRRYDTSNYSYTYKMIEDALVESKVIAGDSLKYVRTITMRPAIKGLISGVNIEITECQS